MVILNGLNDKKGLKRVLFCVKIIDYSLTGASRISCGIVSDTSE